MAFTWILILLPVIQLLSQTISAEDNLACGNLSPKYVFLLVTPINELPNLTTFLNTVTSATLVKNFEDGGITRVFSDPKDWEKIYRYTVDRGIYSSHATRCIDKKEFPASEKFRFPGYKLGNVAVNGPLKNSIDQDPIERRKNERNGNNYAASEGNAAALQASKDDRILPSGDFQRAMKFRRSSSVEAVQNEQQSQRLVRTTDHKTNSKQDSKKPNKKKTSGKKKPFAKGSRGNSLSKNKPSSTTSRSSTYRTVQWRKRGKGHKGTDKNPKTHSRRSLADTSELERRSRAIKKNDDDEDATGSMDEIDFNEKSVKEKKKKQKTNTKKEKKGSGGKKGSKTTKRPSSWKHVRSTAAPLKHHKASVAPQKWNTKCKGGKPCKGLSDDSSGNVYEDEYDADESFTTDTDMDDTTDRADGVENRHHNGHHNHGMLKFHDCPPPTADREPIGKLAEYIYRIFSWVKKLEGKKQKRGEKGK